jgi:predicted RNase H-like nuclease (RuvC/YqgF family)
MDIFNNSIDGRRENIISNIHSSNKTIVYDVKLLKVEIDELKSNIANIEEKLKSIENDKIQEYNNDNKPLFNLENRVSELFNKYAETSTIISITREDLARLNDILSHITGEFYENSLSNHGAYISDLHARVKNIEDSYIKKI